MALSPDDLTRTQEEQDADAMSALEDQIDNYLLEHWNGSCTDIPEREFTEYLPRVRQRVMNKFRSCGWDIKYEGKIGEGYYRFAKASRFVGNIPGR